MLPCQQRVEEDVGVLCSAISCFMRSCTGELLAGVGEQLGGAAPLLEADQQVALQHLDLGDEGAVGLGQHQQIQGAQGLVVLLVP